MTITLLGLPKELQHRVFDILREEGSKKTLSVCLTLCKELYPVILSSFWHDICLTAVPRFLGEKLYRLSAVFHKNPHVIPMIRSLQVSAVDNHRWTSSMTAPLRTAIAGLPNVKHVQLSFFWEPSALDPSSGYPFISFPVIQTWDLTSLSLSHFPHPVPAQACAFFACFPNLEEVHIMSTSLRNTKPVVECSHRIHTPVFSELRRLTLCLSPFHDDVIKTIVAGHLFSLGRLVSLKVIVSGGKMGAYQPVNLFHMVQEIVEDFTLIHSWKYIPSSPWNVLPLVNATSLTFDINTMFSTRPIFMWWTSTLVINSKVANRLERIILRLQTDFGREARFNDDSWEMFSESLAKFRCLREFILVLLPSGGQSLEETAWRQCLIVDMRASLGAIRDDVRVSVIDQQGCAV